MILELCLSNIFSFRDEMSLGLNVKVVVFMDNHLFFPFVLYIFWGNEYHSPYDAIRPISTTILTI